MRQLVRDTILGGIALGALAAGEVRAQAAAPLAPPAAEGLADIIVTAQKRSENLQDVPIAVSAINTAQIEARFGRDIADLGGIAPNLIIDPIYGVASAAISIRGLQLNDGEKSFDPAVAVYLDGVYLASTTGALLSVFDAEAVEVLRGPQGTLFGRNTIGGLVNVRRRAPTGELGGKLIATYGRFDQADIKGVLDLPSIADGAIAAKVSFTSLNGGGYFYNPVRRKQEGNNDFDMYSAALRIEPSADLRLVINYDYIDDNTDTRPVTALTAPGELFCTPGIPGCGRPASDARFHRRPVTAERQRQWYSGHSLIANGQWDFSRNHSLVTVLGYRTSEEYSLQKFDGVEPKLFFVIRPQQLDQFSAELRYQGDFGPVKTVLGSYFYDSSYKNTQRVFFFGGEVDGFTVDHATKNAAAFGQLDWSVLDRLTLTVGGRYTDEEKSVCSRVARGPTDARVDIAAFGACPDAVQNSPIYVTDSVDPITGTVSRQPGRKRWTSFTPKVGLTYDYGDGIVYASYSEGFRSGGYNGRATSAFSLGPYNPEKVKNYEIGVKSEWFDNRFQANLTAFHMDYSDKQEDVVFPDPNAVTVTLVQNAAGAQIRGLEAELKALPTTGLTLGLNVGYLDAKYKDWSVIGFNLDPATAAAQPNVTVDKSDFKLRRAPRWSFDVNANYEYEIGSERSLVANIDYRWKDDYYIIANTVTFAEPNPGLVESFGLLDASLSYQARNYQLSIFGKNLTGEDYFQHVLDVGTNFGATPTDATPVPIAGLWTYGTIGAPTIYGVELQLKF